MSKGSEKVNTNYRKRYKANPEKFRAAGRERYKKNRAACIASTIAWQKANPNKVKETVLRNAFAKRLRKYDLTDMEYAEMVIEQGNTCAVCLSKKEDWEEWHIDHCHTTNVVRGLLCGNCNKALGLIKDKSEVADRMAIYLKKAGKK